MTERSCDGYLVGGYVRDQLLGRDTHDLDLAVGRQAISLARETANRLGGAFVLLDEERQTARVVLREREHLFYVDFATLRGAGLEADLAGRDYTINAMAIDLRETGPQPQLIDPYRGQEDLEKRLVRAVSDTVFQDDPVRLLRAVRLAAELEMQVEGHTRELMRRNASLITLTSPERARDEVCKTLDTERAAASLRELDQLGILTLLIPELEPLRGMEQPPPHHDHALEHCLATVEGVEAVYRALRRMAVGGAEPVSEDGRRESDIIRYLDDALSPFAEQMVVHLSEKVVGERSRLMLLKLAGLLHDLGKATTGKADDQGRIRFFGHQVEGTAVAARVCRRLHFGNREVRLVRTVVRHHMRPRQLAKEDRVTPRATHRFFRDTGENGVDVLLHSLADNLAVWRAGHDLVSWRKLCQTVGLLLTKYYEEYDEVIEPPPLLRGSDLLSQLGMKPGPAVGRVLRAIKEAQATGEVSTRKEALALAAVLLAGEE